MQEKVVLKILQEQLKFNKNSIEKLKLFSQKLITANQSYNFISKSTENDIWGRHILDSAQLVKFIDFNSESLSDLGTGGGFPGVVLALFNQNNDFHVKLYEKSPVKRQFLNKVVDELDIKATIKSNIYDHILDTDVIVCRAFKKLDQVIQVSREIAKKTHKLIILKGQNAQEEINNTFKKYKYPYKLEKSMTNSDSQIIIIKINK
jgi:16S rRNA (guanine527-N7)-methyltransferase